MGKENSSIRVGVLGYGYWGPNLARNVQASGSCELAAIADVSTERLAQARLTHGSVRLTNDWNAVVSDLSIDAVVVATPFDSHFELASAALIAGKHVFLEKPMTHTSVEAIRLIEESERRRLVLMVDHTYLFEPAVHTISKVLCSGELGKLTLWQSERTNHGAVRRDANVLWDLAAHDLSILDHVLTSSPNAISAVGTSSGGGQLEHSACLTLHFQDSLIARIHVNWLAQRKVRRISIHGEAGLLTWDDLDPAQKVTLTPYAAPDRTSVIKIEVAEPLDRSIQHFADCIDSCSRPIADGAAGLRVVRFLEAADRSMQSGGRTVMLDGLEAIA